MPANTTYKSPQIQNEIIHIIAEELRNTIVTEIKDSSYLSLMAAGTKDRNGDEMVSIAFRYLKQGMEIEALLAIEKQMISLH